MSFSDGTGSSMTECSDDLAAALETLRARWRAATGSERWVAAHRQCAAELAAALGGAPSSPPAPASTKSQGDEAVRHWMATLRQLERSHSSNIADDPGAYAGYWVSADELDALP